MDMDSADIVRKIGEERVEMLLQTDTLAFFQEVKKLTDEFIYRGTCEYCGKENALLKHCHAPSTEARYLCMDCEDSFYG